MVRKKNMREEKLKEKVKNQGRIIEMLSNEKVVRGLMNSLEDIKKGRYIILTN